MSMIKINEDIYATTLLKRSNEIKDRLDEIEKKIELMERVNRKFRWKRRRKWR